MNLKKNEWNLNPIALPGTIEPKILSKTIQALMESQNLILCAHHNPDGDTLGSITALAEILSANNPKKHIYLYSRDLVPYMYAFLPRAEQITNIVPDLSKYDTIAFVDVGEASRVSEEMEAALKKSKTIKQVVIDHHPQPPDSSRLEFIDPASGATGELIFYIAQELEVPISKEIASALYCCIHTDTGGFAFSNTTARLLKIAARITEESGFDLHKTISEIYENQPPEQLKLIASALASLEMFADNQGAAISVTQETYKETGATVAMTERLINFPRSLTGVIIAVQFRELESGNKWKISLRSKSGIDVNKLARQFGGGGHPQASGLTLEGTLDEVKAKVYEAVVKAIKNSR